ncbi:hypothetical protein ACFPC0_10945 [Streptomyces andamanensis]|uniref:Uncharacterized protein n=1 Tax=Streptomyces andamanensis TaxID=1565035 RepID=A0ABV8TCM9_9ACTN
MSKGWYVVGEGTGRRKLLLGPFRGAWETDEWVVRVRAEHRRLYRTAYGWSYRVECVEGPPGRELPPGDLNGRMKLKVSEPDVLLAKNASGRTRYVPYTGAEFRHASMSGEGGGPAVCRITRHDQVTLWFRPIGADGKLGDLYRHPLAEFKEVMAEWIRHPFAAPEAWAAYRPR